MYIYILLSFFLSLQYQYQLHLLWFINFIIVLILLGFNLRKIHNELNYLDNTRHIHTYIDFAIEILFFYTINSTSYCDKFRIQHTHI